MYLPLDSKVGEVRVSIFGIEERSRRRKLNEESDGQRINRSERPFSHARRARKSAPPDSLEALKLYDITGTVINCPDVQRIHLLICILLRSRHMVTGGH